MPCQVTVVKTRTIKTAQRSPKCLSLGFDEHFQPFAKCLGFSPALAHGWEVFLSKGSYFSITFMWSISGQFICPKFCIGYMLDSLRFLLCPLPVMWLLEMSEHHLHAWFSKQAPAPASLSRTVRRMEWRLRLMWYERSTCGLGFQEQSVMRSEWSCKGWLLEKAF